MGAVRTTFAMVAALIVRRRQLEVLGVAGNREGLGRIGTVSGCLFRLADFINDTINLRTLRHTRYFFDTLPMFSLTKY